MKLQSLLNTDIVTQHFGIGFYRKYLKLAELRILNPLAPAQPEDIWMTAYGMVFDFDQITPDTFVKLGLMTGDEGLSMVHFAEKCLTDFGVIKTIDSVIFQQGIVTVLYVNGAIQRFSNGPADPPMAKKGFVLSQKALSALAILLKQDYSRGFFLDDSVLDSEYTAVP